MSSKSNSKSSPDSEKESISSTSPPEPLVFKHSPYGSPIPFSEPSWYRGCATPYYDHRHVLFRNKCRDFVDKYLIPHVDEWDESGTCPIQQIRQQAASCGVLTPWGPPEFGAKSVPEGGWDLFMFIIWGDELSRCGAAGVAILIFITYMSIPHILEFGNDEQKERIARPILEGKQGMAITLTEPSGGSDLANLKTTARKSECGKYYIVNGSKKFITGGMCVDWFSTLVRTGVDKQGKPLQDKEHQGIKGLSMLAIPSKSKGISIKKLYTSGWWSGNTTLVNFEDVYVPIENLIGSEGIGFLVMTSVMNGERLIGCIGPIRASRVLLSEAIKFSRERKTFNNQKLSSSQVIRHKFANMSRMIEAAQALTESLCYQMKHGASLMEIGGNMALCKVECTRCYEYCAREASQVLGGASFVRGGKGRLVERLAREIRVNVVGGGSEEILLDLAMRMSKIWLLLEEVVKKFCLDLAMRMSKIWWLMEEVVKKFCLEFGDEDEQDMIVDGGGREAGGEIVWNLGMNKI